MLMTVYERQTPMDQAKVYAPQRGIPKIGPFHGGRSNSRGWSSKDTAVGFCLRKEMIFLALLFENKNSGKERNLAEYLGHCMVT